MYETVDDIKNAGDWICHILDRGDLAPQLTYRFNARATRFLGRAHANTLCIEFSVSYWKGMTDRCRFYIITHEVCHLIAFTSPGGFVEASFGLTHGPIWATAMIKAGATPYAVANAERDGFTPRKRPTYVCTACKHENQIGPIQLKRAQAGTRQYYCPHCHDNITKQLSDQRSAA